MDERLDCIGQIGRGEIVSGSAENSFATYDPVNQCCLSDPALGVAHLDRTQGESGAPDRKAGGKVTETGADPAAEINHVQLG